MKKQWIDGILEKYHRLNEACDDVIDVGAMDIEGLLFKAIWGAWEHLLEQCDHDDWIAWYIHDNDCGERRHRIYPSGSSDGIVIDSTEALARFLVEWDRIERDAELQERERYAAALRLHRENNPEAVTGHEGCHWEQNEDGWWNTDCGNAFEFKDGSPIYNGFKTCPYCGEKLRETPHAEDESSSDRSADFFKRCADELERVINGETPADPGCDWPPPNALTAAANHEWAHDHFEANTL